MRIVTRVLIATALAFGLGCGQTDWIDRTLVTVDVTGAWFGEGGGLIVWLELEQEGSKVKGSIRMQGGGAGRVGGSRGEDRGPVEGAVAGDVFTFKESNGPLEGELTVSGDEMTGRVSTTFGSRPISLRRVQSPSRPGPPPR